MAALQVKNVPEKLHQLLRKRAEELECTIGEVILDALERDLNRPRMSDWLTRLEALPKTKSVKSTSVQELKKSRDL